MPDKKKISDEIKTGKREISLDDLEKVQGGSISDVNYTDTTDISDDTKKKI